jgi:DNA replication and repair protein RecF
MIKSIKLTDFRNFKKKTLKFSPRTTVIVGPNASGKTNILEAIVLVATGKSFRARVEEEMIKYSVDLARIVTLINANEDVNLEVVLTRGEVEVGEDKYEKAPRKKLLVNGVSRRLMDFAGKLKVVLFAPQDLDLVTQAPTQRRRFLDMVLSQVDREYARALLSYDKGLRQRNRLLLRIREEGLSRSQLLFWDRLLIKNGDYINQRRGEFIEFANVAKFKFQNSNFKIEYDPSSISEGRLEQYAQEEVAAATTLVGPHRDDFAFKIKPAYRRGRGERQELKERDLAIYGSRGEQRMGVLWLKMAELAFIEEKSGQKPTLLLDDIFSELDHKHREVVMESVKNQQSIITTADEHYIEGIEGVEKILLR